uniref:Integrase catalytic domain-containing protein n=1 Tax=Ananas comosus var. bracteatus TaxID=296719 RepID=A0A6V7QBY1_ANACO|nr:unnamed protein product [Ananas comosus var. bracteatus]
MKSRDEERKKLIEELIARVDEVEDLKTRVTILEKAGNRDEKEIDNFLWHMEHYFKALRLGDKEEKVQAASMYLADDAMLWWRRRSAEAEKGQCSLKTWEDFVRELKALFYPEHGVDRFFKYGTFIAAPADCTAEEAARLFVSHIVKLWGIPTSIVSDRDPRFTGKFWTEVKTIQDALKS